MDRDKNLVTVQRADSSQLAYDPVRLQGVNIYRESQRNLSEEDRIQFTTPYRQQRIANRELGMVERIDGRGNLRVRLDSGRQVQFNVREHAHLDYGYAVTSHSSQDVTADRVLVQVDTSQANQKLLNMRLAYVAVSRGRYDAQIFTNGGDSPSAKKHRRLPPSNSTPVPTGSPHRITQQNQHLKQ
jgi:ATP-dependent exoDNAse (exonuclease V) alpha subunit